MSLIDRRVGWSCVATCAALALLAGTHTALADAPDLTGTCWQLDWSIYFNDEPVSLSHTRTRIVEFAAGTPGGSVNATWLTPQTSADYTHDNSGWPHRFMARDHYFGEYPGTYRWPADVDDPRMVDGKCEPARPDCAYMWLEAQPLAAREKRVAMSRPANYGSFSASELKAVDRRILREKLTYWHNRTDRLELEVETVRQKLKISGKASNFLPPLLLQLFNITAAQLDCDKARTLAATFLKAPRPPDEQPRPPPASGTTTGPEDPFES